MGGKTTTTATSKIASFVLIFLNFITMLTCAVIFAIGVWTIASPYTLSNFIQNYGNNTIKALLPQDSLNLNTGLTLTLVAIFICFIAFMGFYGAVVRSTFLLFMYSLITLLLLLLECALLYYFITGFKQKGLQEKDGQWTHGVRLLFKCCEFNSTNTSITVWDKLPWSCCGSEAYPANCTVSYIYNNNCQQRITSWLHKYEMALYTSLAALHIILSSCSLMRRQRSNASLSYS